MKSLVSAAVVAVCLIRALPAAAQADVEKLRRDHERQMRDVEQRQKAERERMDRDFQNKLERATKKDPAADEISKRCAELLRQIEKLASDVRELQSRVAPSGNRRVIQRVIEGFKDGQPSRVVPQDLEELELEIVPEEGKKFEFKQVVPKKKRIVIEEDDERREF